MIQQIENHIKFLLHLHDCVILPGFGGLVAAYRPATADTQRGLLTPPAKEIGFNSALKRDDGLLAHHIALHQRMHHHEAVEAIGRYVRHIRHELESHGTYNFEEVGEFNLQRGGQLSFTPTREENYLASSYGLYPVSIITEHRQQHKEVAGRKTVPGWLRPALIALPIAAVIGSVSWLGYADQGFRQQFSSIVPVFGKPVVEYRERYAFRPETGVEAAKGLHPSNTNPAISYLDLSDDEHAFLWPVWNAEETPQPVALGKSGITHIVAGCFAGKENAEKQVKLLKAHGLDAFIAGKYNGLYRVSAGRFEARTEAETVLGKIRATACPSAWLWKES